MHSQPREVEINVPWGHIACKTWGVNIKNEANKTKHILLFVHDLHDNAASSDGLINELNQLQENICIAIDLPGHGKSSPLNEHTTYHYLDNLIIFKYIIYNLLKRYNKLNQPKKQIILIAHGNSANLATIFTQIYPKLVSKLILLDGMYYYGIKSRHIVDQFRQSINKYFEIEHFIATKSPKEFTLENVYETFVKNYQNKDFNETVHNLAVRGSRKIDNGNYLMRNDIRLENILMPTCGFHYMIDFLRKERISCPVLIICTKVLENEYRQFLNVLKLKNSKVSVVNVGVSNLHFDKPKEVSEIIGTFLRLKANKL